MSDVTILHPVPDAILHLPLGNDRVWRHFTHEYDRMDCSRRGFLDVMEILRLPRFQIQWDGMAPGRLPDDFIEHFNDPEMRWLDRYREASLTDPMRPRARSQNFIRIRLLDLTAKAHKVIRRSGDESII